MKKTLTANISGTVFHVEEDAYEALQRYLAALRAQFSGSEGCDEIMADIEARVAELLQERLDGRQVVTTAEVDHVIGVLGKPEDISEEAGAFVDEEPSPASGSAPRGSKRLFRDPDDRWVGGVLSGVAAYFGFDPLILRLIYLAFLFLGFGFILYVILWIVVPKATTAADRLQMRGEPVTAENIKRAFEEGAGRVKEGAQSAASDLNDLGRRHGPQVRSKADDFFGFLGQAIILLVKAIGKILGVVLLVVGATLLVVLLMALVGRFSFAWEALDLTDGTTLHDLALLIFNSPAQFTWSWIAATLAVLIPVVGLLYGGIHLLFGLKAPKWVGISLAPIWFAAIIVLSWQGVLLANDFSDRETRREVVTLQQPTGQVLYLDALPDPHFGPVNARQRHGGDLELMKLDGEVVYLGWADMDVEQSPDSLFHLRIERQARGTGIKSAGRRAGAIQHDWEQVDSMLYLAPWFSFPKEDRFRAQDVHFTVLVPIGKAVHFEPGVEPVMYDVENVTDTWDRDMLGRTWTMTSGGLSADVRPEDVPDDIRPIHRKIKSEEPAEAPEQEAPARDPVVLAMPNLWEQLMRI